MAEKRSIITLYRITDKEKLDIKKKYRSVKLKLDAVFFGDAALVLKSDGTVEYNEYTVGGKNVCNRISGWEDIVKIVSGTEHAAALTADGKVKAIGRNDYGQCNVMFWENVADIFAHGYCTIGITYDDETYIAGVTSERLIAQQKKNSDELKRIEYFEGLIEAKISQLARTQSYSVPNLQTHENNFDYSVNEKEKTVIAVSAGKKFTLFLHKDGTVKAAGQDNDGQCDVNRWKNIIAISAGKGHSVGLRANGTINIAGDADLECCSFPRRWMDIKQIVAGDLSTFAIDNYKDLFVSGYCGSEGKYWKDIIRPELLENGIEKINGIAIGKTFLIALRKDGRVLVEGFAPPQIKTKVKKWYSITDVASCGATAYGLNSDGTVVAAGNDLLGQCGVENWKDIVQISAGDNFIIGLKKDGTVVAAGDNRYGQCNVGKWTDIIQISAGYTHTVGLRKDGTVLMIGDHGIVE